MSVASNGPDHRHLRRFGLTVAAGFALVGGLSWWRDHVVAPLALLTLAALILVPALVAPALLPPLERAWLTLGGWLAWVNTRIILTALFYAVVTPVGVFMRFFRDPLDRRLYEAQTSYWIRRTTEPFDAKRYERQF